MMPAVGAYCDDPPPFTITPDDDTTYKAVGTQVVFQGECYGTGAHVLQLTISGGLTGVEEVIDGNKITKSGDADTPDSYTVSGKCTAHECSAEVTLKISDVTGLTVSGATLINGKYYVAKGDDAPEITATIAGDIPPDFVNWSGATQDPEDQTRATRSTATAGECTVECWLDGQPNDQEDSAKESVTIVVVGVKNVQISANGTWHNVDGTPTEVLLKGTKYTFKAIPDPQNAEWPSGMPEWSCDPDLFGAVPGTETVNATFAYGPGDGETITAVCGTSSVRL